MSAEKEAKCQKTFDAKELVCPITHDLPFDPVTAEDGHVYERSDIEKWMKGKADGAIKSPMTNQPMGKRLLPAPQAKNTIEGLIDCGVITGDEMAPTAFNGITSSPFFGSRKRMV